MIILQYVILAAWYIVMTKLIMSWLISFDVLNVNQPVIRKVWEFLQRLLEPVYRPIRRVIPTINGMDFSPMVVLIGLMILRRAFHV